jgi:4-aminobutyrate aminotransferase
MFGIDHFDVDPDLVWVAKGMASGMPMGAVVCRKALDFPYQGAHSNTYGGNLVAIAAADATLDAIEQDDLLANAQQTGEYLHQRLRELQESHDEIGDVRGLGLMQAIDLVKNRSTKEPAKKLQGDVVQGLFKRGILVLPCGASAIRFIPPLTIDEDSIDACIEVLRETLKAV